MKGRLILRAALGAGLLAALVSISLAAGAADDIHMKGAVTRSGRPVRSAWVILTRNGDEKGKSLTGDDGRYYIGGLDAGEYEIEVKQGPYNLFAGRVRLPEESLYDVEVRRR